VDYRSAVFGGVRRLLKMTADRDPRLLSWLAGLIGGGVEGVDPIEARMDFGLFADTALRSEPLREGDVRFVNDMVFFQQRNQTGVVWYDSRTGIEWKWDGSPLCHVVACAFGREASKRLGDDREYAACAALECGALEAIADRSAEAARDLSDLARDRAATLRRQHDIGAALASLEGRNSGPGNPSRGQAQS
jgi:hypothetical protein